MTEPALKTMRVLSTQAAGLTATATLSIGPFTNAITVRRFVENCGAAPTGTTPTTALTITDDDASGASVASKSAAALVQLSGTTTQAENTGAADGYKLAAGNVIKCVITVAGTSPVFPGYSLDMEYVEGIG